MSNSLQSQLLKMGLVDDKKVKQVKKEKHKQAKQRGKKAVVVDEASRLAQQAAAEKAERDRELNRQRKEEAERKALAAQVRQLIEVNRLPKGEGEIPYNFNDNNKVKRLYVTEQMQRQLGLGRLAIVRLDEQYELVPSAVAEKIRQRDESCVILCNEPEPHSDEDDPYADYQIPDDLMW